MASTSTLVSTVSVANGGTAGTSSGGSAGSAAGGAAGAAACNCQPGFDGTWNPVVVTSTAADACPTGSGSDFSAAESFKDTGCACKCGGLVGSECSLDLTFWQTSGCTGSTPQTIPDLGNDQCQKPATANSVKFVSQVKTVGNCAKSATKNVIGKVGERKVCKVEPVNGCGSGGKCFPSLPSGFTACIAGLNTGTDPSCPGDYPVAVKLYTGATDTRTCNATPCSCGTPTTSCAGAFSVNACPSNLCSSTKGSGCQTIKDSSCTSLTGQGYYVTGVATPTGSCAPSGTPGEGGSVAPDASTLHKLCCTKAL